MAFNLKNYESVKQRKKRFYETNPDGRIVVNAERISENEAVFFVEIYKNREDQQARLPWATGYAQEFKGTGSMANKISWCENCEESAIGRALDNAGYANFNGPSLEEMQKVERFEREDIPENYTIEIGKLTGKKLSEVSREELEETHLKLNEYLKTNKTVKPIFKETASKIESYLNTQG